MAGQRAHWFVCLVGLFARSVPTAISLSIGSDAYVTDTVGSLGNTSEHHDANEARGDTYFKVTVENCYWPTECQHSLSDLTEMEFYSSDGLLSPEVVGCSQETPLRVKSSNYTETFNTSTRSDDCRSRICSNILDRGTSCGETDNHHYSTGFQGASMITFAPGTWFLVRARGAVVLNQVKAYGNWGGRWPGDIHVEQCTSASADSCSTIYTWNCGAPTSNSVPCDSGRFRYTAPMHAWGMEAGGAAAVGDPHLQNVHGERFDLFQAGKYVLINIPRGTSAEKALLRVQAEARKLGGQCADMFFQEVNVTGSWAEAERAGGYHYSASQHHAETPAWLAFGSSSRKVELKVVHGHTLSGVSYLNVYVKHLRQTGFAVGGLLGEDDHEEVSIAPTTCAHRLSLADSPEGGRTAPSVLSYAIASLD